MSYPARSALTWVMVLFGTVGLHVQAQTLQPPFDSSYTVFDLGPVPGLLAPNGGLAFLNGDPNTLLIGGEANTSNGKLYSIAVVRDAQNHIVGFTDVATVFAEAQFNDGGVVYGPEGVLFLARWPNNELGQILPGSAVTNKVIDLVPLGVVESPGGLNFVSPGFPGAGSFKLVSWPDGGWYTLQLAPDGTGTFDVTSATWETNIPGGPEGFVYITPGSPQFTDFSNVLVMDWTEDSISVYDVDGNGDPIPGTRTLFMTDVTGPEGATIDPLTGDLLFSFFTLSREEILVVRGFAPPPPDEEPPAECEDPRPAGQGYWQSQCRALEEHPGRGNPRRSPRRPTELGFTEALVPCADAKLAELGFPATSTCDGLDASPPRDPCERAMKRLTSLVLNVCSSRVQESCAVDAHPEGCSSATVDELLHETADLIRSGFCLQAAACNAVVEQGLALIEP